MINEELEEYTLKELKKDIDKLHRRIVKLEKKSKDVWAFVCPNCRTHYQIERAI